MHKCKPRAREAKTPETLLLLFQLISPYIPFICLKQHCSASSLQARSSPRSHVTQPAGPEICQGHSHHPTQSPRPDMEHWAKARAWYDTHGWGHMPNSLWAGPSGPWTNTAPLIWPVGLTGWALLSYISRLPWSPCGFSCFPKPRCG